MSSEPLVATADPRLLDHAVRWCAAVGTSPDVTHDLVGLRRSWRSAPAVLLGVDLAERLGRGELVRRDRVVLLADDPDSAWRQAVDVGAVEVVGPSAEDHAVRAVAAAVDGRREACLVTVVGAVGGAGATTFAALLGLAGARRGLEPLVVDADPWGGGVDLALGAERVEGARWQDLDPAGGPWGASALQQALPSAHGTSFLTWDRDRPVGTVPALRDVTTTAVRGFDLVVLDLPRHRLDAEREALGASVVTVLVTPDDVRSVAAARRVAAELDQVVSDLVVIAVRRGPGVGRSGLGEVLQRPVSGTVRPTRGVRTALERGGGPGSSRSGRRAAAAVLDLLGMGPVR